MVTLTALYRQIKEFYEQHDMDSGPAEAREIICRFCGTTKDRFFLWGDLTADESQTEACLDAARRRAAHEPLQYILGEWTFFGGAIRCFEGVLIPRPETELLCEVALSKMGPRGAYEAMDLGCGSGAIAVTLAANSEGRVLALDISPDCLEATRTNSELRGVSGRVTARQGSMLEPCGESGRFELIVSNPPYVRSDEMAALQPEVRCEPALALDGGADGLDFYRAIVKNYAAALKPGGWLLFEVGLGQAEQVARLLADAEFRSVETHDDFAGIARVVGGQKI